MAFEEDLDPFFADWGIGVTVAPQTDGATVISAIFDHAYIETLDFSGVAPRLMVKSSDVSDNAIKVGTVIEVNERRYLVAWPPQPDGTGMSELWMHFE